MRILWIATKTPLPATDGGRLVAALTIEALIAAGAHVTLVAPSRARGKRESPASRTILIDDEPLSWPRALLRSIRSSRPLSIERHASPATAARVAELVTSRDFDIVHVEQVQALPWVALARNGRLARVLRCQNVESAVWSTAADVARAPHAAVLRREAQRLCRFEQEALKDVETIVALSADDAIALRALAPHAAIQVIPPPMPERLAGSTSHLGDEPSFVWIGSAGWAVNDDAIRWLLDEIWPAIAARLPTARLHLFGPSVRRATRVVHHPAPLQSVDAFATGSVLLLPLRASTGVRMRILEAWARGVPVIASPAAVAGLVTRANDDVMVADSPDAFAEAAGRLTASRALREDLVAGGRAALRTYHRPDAIAAAMLGVYEQAIARRHSTIAQSQGDRRDAAPTRHVPI
jgi:glycosyltransferase involved in cell wall biosynthesis